MFVSDSLTSRFSAFLLKYRWLLLLGGALLMGLAVIFPQVGVFQWVILIPSLWVIFTRLSDRGVRYRVLYGMGFCFFWVYYTVCFHWFLWMYPLDYAGFSPLASAVVVCLGSVGLAAFQAAGAAVIFPLFGYAVRGKHLSRLPLLHPFLFAALWTAVEWWQAHSGWSGVPWGRLCLGQAEVLVTLQSASLLGSYFVSFLILAVNGMVAYTFLFPSRRQLCGILAIALTVGNLAFGLVYMNTSPPSDRTVKVAAIQGNLASGDEWGAIGSVGRALDVYGDLTREAAAEGAEIVLWPETAIVSNLYYVEDELTSLATECNVTILAGLFTDHPTQKGDYNSIVAILPDGRIHESAYHKRNLVPFGEFVPLRGLITALVPPLAEINTLGEDLAFGEEAVVISLPEGDVAPLICFDSIYEQNALESVRDGAELLAIPTNDSWFKDSRGVWMHSGQAQLRAIETGRYVLRAANTGVSSVITDRGEVVDKLPPFETGYVLAEAEMQTYTTPYAVIGNLFAYLCLGFGAGCCLLPLGEWLLSKRKKKNIKKY